MALMRSVQLADEGTSSAGAMTSRAGEDHVTAERAADDGSCSPSSVTIVDLDAMTDDERQLADGDQADSAAGRPTTLRVPTPSSWEKYRVVVPATSPLSPGIQSTTAQSVSGDADVRVVVVADHRNDEMDRRSLKKSCSCGAASTDSQVTEPSLVIICVSSSFNIMLIVCRRTCWNHLSCARVIGDRFSCICYADADLQILTEISVLTLSCLCI